MSLIELACYDASCAPPPVGTGGSTKGGGGGKTFPLQPSPKNSLARGSVKWKSSAEQGREHSQKLLTQDEVYAEDDASMWQASAAVMDAVSNAPTVSDPMYRGMALVSDSELAVQLRGAKVGESLDLGLSGFSLKQGLAMSFARAGGPNNFHVLVELEGGAKAFDVDQAADKAGMNEQERIAAGSFEVLSIHEGKTYTYESNDGTKSYVGPVEIVLRQTEPLKIPDGLDSWADKLYIKQSDVDAAEEQRKMIESWRTTTASALIELACHDASCAPPPTGTGGSSKGSGGDAPFDFTDFLENPPVADEPYVTKNPSDSSTIEWGQVDSKTRGNKTYPKLTVADVNPPIKAEWAGMRRQISRAAKTGQATGNTGAAIGSLITSTQDALRSKGTEVVTLYRGADSPTVNPFTGNDNEGTRIQRSPILADQSSGITSWTTSPELASAYGTVLMQAKVPVSQIISWDVVGLMATVPMERVKGNNPHDTLVNGNEVLVAENTGIVDRLMNLETISDAESLRQMKPGWRVAETTTASALIELACYESSCAPPPVGTGGSSKGAGGIPVLDSINPTGGVFVDYDPKSRTGELGGNLTTLDKVTDYNPEDTVTVYRGASANQTKLNSGDFITTSEQLAGWYGDVVIEQVVKAKEIITDADEVDGEEYIYRQSGGSSKSGGSMVGDNTLTNPKEYGTGGTKYLVEGPILDHFYKKLESMKEQVFPEGLLNGAKVTLVKSNSEINHQLYIMTADIPNLIDPEWPPHTGRDVARISWDPKTGIIEAIQTNETFQRQGLATDVFDAATILAKQFDLVPPAHSENLTTDGEAWAAAEKARGQSNSTTASALIELACHDASCAPPPTGTGGSSDGGGEPKGAGAYSFDEMRATYKSWKWDPKYIRDASFSILMGEENGEIGQPRRSSNDDYTEAAIVLDMVVNAPTSSVQLFRGLALNPAGVLGREISSLEIGEEVDWPPSGFSSDESVADVYYGKDKSNAYFKLNTRALIVLEPGAKAWSIDDDHDWSSSTYSTYRSEKEHIVAGGFVVVDIEEREDRLGPYKVITIEQSEPLEMPWSEDGEAKSWMDIVPPDARAVLGSSSLIELACYESSCAPPPVGTGGSTKGASSVQRGSTSGISWVAEPSERASDGMVGWVVPTDEARSSLASALKDEDAIEIPADEESKKEMKLYMARHVKNQRTFTGETNSMNLPRSQVDRWQLVSGMTSPVDTTPYKQEWTDSETVRFWQESAKVVASASQRFLKSKFGKGAKILLYRGIDDSSATMDPLAGNPRGNKDTGVASGITSWTTNPNITQKYGGRLVAAAVPIENILSWDIVGIASQFGTGGEVLVHSDPAVISRTAAGDFPSIKPPITASADIELACYDASCAPPPVGTGGSSDSGGQLSPLKIKTRKSKILKKAIRDWKGSAVQTREQSVRLIEEEKVDVVTSPVEWANAATLMDAVSEAPMVNKFLYRGISLDPSTELAVQLSGAKVGDSLDWGLSGFSTYETFATNFTQKGGPDHVKVEFIIEGGAKALDIDAMHKGPYAWEEEHLVAGTFEVLNVWPPPEGYEREPTKIVLRQTEPLKIPDGLDSWADKLYVQESDITASANMFSGLEMYGFACYDASCAPPPIGTGGSSKSGTGPAKGGYMDGFKPFSTVDDDGEPLSDELLIDELAVEVGERVAEGKPIWDPKTVAVDSVGIALANTERTIVRGEIDVAAMKALSGDALAEYISIEPGVDDAYRAYLETGEYPEGTEFLMGAINRDPIAAETFFTYAENSARTAGVYDERMNTAEGKQITQEVQAQYAAVLENPRISKLLDRLGVSVPFVEVSHFPLLQGPNQEMHRTFGGQWMPLDAPEPIASYINGMITLRSIAGEQVGGSELSGYEQPISISLPGDFRTGRDLVGIPGDNGSTVTHELGHFIHQAVRGGRDAVENNPAVVPNQTGVLWNNAWSKYHDEMNADTITSRAGAEAGSSGLLIHQRVVQPRQVSDYSHQNQYEGFAETFNAVISGADTSGLSNSGQEMVATMEAIIDGGPALDRMLAAQESGAGT